MSYKGKEMVKSHNRLRSEWTPRIEVEKKVTYQLSAPGIIVMKDKKKNLQNMPRTSYSRKHV